MATPEEIAAARKRLRAAVEPGVILATPGEPDEPSGRTIRPTPAFLTQADFTGIIPPGTPTFDRAPPGTFGTFGGGQRERVDIPAFLRRIQQGETPLERPLIKVHGGVEERPLRTEDFTGILGGTLQFPSEPKIQVVPVETLQGEFASLVDSLDDLFIPFDAFSEGVIALIEPLIPGAGSERAAESRKLILGALMGDPAAIQALGEQFQDRPGQQQFWGSLIDIGIIVGLAKTPVRGLTRVLGKTLKEATESLPDAVRVAIADERGFLGLPSLPKRTSQGTFKSSTVPSEAAQKAFGLETITTLDLSRVEQLKNIAKGALNMVVDDPVGTAVTRYRKKHLQNLESNATAVSHEKDAILQQAFEIDDAGRVLDSHLQGVHPERPNPGRSDLTEGFGTFQRYMRKDQIDAIEAIKVLEEPYAAVAKELGIAEAVVEEGGFYSTRGRVVDGEQFLGNSGSDRPRIFASHGEGIEWAEKNGFTYPSYRVAEASRITDLGKRSVNKQLGDYLKSAVDPEDGLPVASTARSRMPNDLRLQYDAMTGKIRSRRETIKQQTVRVTLLEREAGRGAKAVESASERSARVEKRLTEKGAAYTPDDMRNVRDDLTNAIEEAQTFAGFVKEDAGLLRSGNKVLNKTEKRLDAAVDKLLDDVAEADRFIQITPATGVKLDIAAADRQMDALSAKVVRLTDDAVAASEKVDKLLEAAAISKDVSLSTREGIRASRRLQRNIFDQNRTVQSLQREQRALQREEGRLAKALEGSESRLNTAEVRNIKTRESLLALQDESGELTTAYKAWQRREPRGQTIIPKLHNVSGSSFPDELARAINMELERGGAPFPLNIIQAESQLYRAMRATGEFSAAGIQLMFGLYNDPKAYAQAIKVMFRGFGTERALGQFLVERSAIAKAAGRLTSVEWARLGLRLGAGDTEFRLGQGVFAALEKVPLVERLNRSFGFASDGMRFAWIDDILAEELSKKSLSGQGRTLAEMKASGDLERLANFINNATGWHRDRFLGPTGEFFMFAPRFFQSRFTTLAKSVGGLLPGALIDQRLASKGIVKMIGWGVFMTVAANEVLGNETDFRPFLNDSFEPSWEPSSRRNPNFIRIRAAGRDWSLFGTWDSMLGVLISVASGRPLDPLRALSSGPVQLAWDQITGRGFLGEEVPRLQDDPAGFAWWFIKSHFPFATQEGKAAVEQVTEGIGLNPKRAVSVLLGDQVAPIPAEPGTPSTDVGGQAVFEPDAGELIRGAGSLFAGAFGVKGTPVTKVEERDAVWEQIKSERGLQGDLFDQPPSVVKDVRQDPRYQAANEAVFDSRRGRGSDLQAYRDEVVRIDKEKDKELSLLEGRWRRSQEGFTLNPKEIPIFGREVRERIGELQREKAQEKAILRETDKNKEALAFLDDLDPPTSREGKAQQAFIDAIFDDQLEDSVTGFYDFDERDSRLEKLEADWGADTIATVRATLRSVEHPLVRQLREDRDRLADYFAITERELAKEPELIQRLHEQYMREPPETRKFLLGNNLEGAAHIPGVQKYATLRNFLNSLNQTGDFGRSLQQQWIQDNGGAVVDNILLKWGYRTVPTNALSRKQIMDKIEEQRQRGRGAFR